MVSRRRQANFDLIEQFGTQKGQHLVFDTCFLGVGEQEEVAGKRFEKGQEGYEGGGAAAARRQHVHQRKWRSFEFFRCGCGVGEEEGWSPESSSDGSGRRLEASS